MPKLKICGKDENGVIKVKNKDIEIFAYQQLSEYQKNYFDKPHKLDIDDFIEYYLNRNIRYCGLNHKYDKGKEVILGKTIIKEDLTIIYSDDNEPIIKKLKLGTICVDEKACEKRERINFTLAHECWHSQFDLNLDISVMPVYSGHKFFFSDQKLKIVNIRSPREVDGLSCR